jgi:integrase
MSIRKRGRFYDFEFMEDGRRYSGTLNGRDGTPYAGSKQEARDHESEIRIQVPTGTYGKEVGLTDFGKFFDDVYMKYSKEHKASWKHDEYRGKVFKKFFQGKTFSQITPMLVVGYINQRLASTTRRKIQRKPVTVYKQRSPVTVYKEVRLLSSIFIMAIQEGVAAVNPCASIPKSVKKKLPARNKRDRFLTFEEEPLLLAQLTGRRSHLAPIVRFALETGLRRGELCRLEVGHVNVSSVPRLFLVGAKKVEVMPNELLVEKSKNGKPRVVPLTTEARKIVETQIADVTTKQYLFTSYRTKGMIAEIKSGFTSAVRAAGLEDFRFHDLRHTFATRLNASGADPYTIRDLLGHSSTTMTEDYTHTSRDTRRQAIDAMSAGSFELRQNYDKRRIS